MAAQRIDLESGASVDMEANAAKGGDGVVVSTRHQGADGTLSTSVTCTCYDSGGAHSVTKTCPNGNNTCDCSNPRSPQIYCG
jgi:hypothetical protein